MIAVIMELTHRLVADALKKGSMRGFHYTHIYIAEIMEGRKQLFSFLRISRIMPVVLVR